MFTFDDDVQNQFLITANEIIELFEIVEDLDYELHTVTSDDEVLTLTFKSLDGKEDIVREFYR